MAVKEICVWKWLILGLFFCVNGATAGPFFIVTFPVVIESGSQPKLCVSLYKPNETLSMRIYLVNEDLNTVLFEIKTKIGFHHCLNFQAPLVVGESVQKIKTIIQGRSFNVAEERKVLLKSFGNLTFIQTDKPIYNPGQTVFFRVVTMDDNFVPLDQMYSMVVVEDSKNNRIGQWTNVSSSKWILQLSHELNPEAQLGMYTLMAFIGDQIFKWPFEVKKYVLPKFDITVKVPQTQSVGEVELKIEVCGRYTYEQPVPGKAWVQVCRNPFQLRTEIGMIPLCSDKTGLMNETGCASIIFSTSAFLSSRFESSLQDSLLVNASVTEEGTDIVQTKSETIFLTYEIGRVIFMEIPNIFTRGSVLEGKVRVTSFSGMPIPGKAVYILGHWSWPPIELKSLKTDRNGLASFSISTTSFPNNDVFLTASVTPDNVNGYKEAYFTSAEKTVQLFQNSASTAPTMSTLTIVELKQPLKCGVSFPVTLKYSFVGETFDGVYSTDIVYMVLSKGVIVKHGYETIQVTASNAVLSGTVSFMLSVGPNLAPVVQILAYCVLPSESVVADGKHVDTENCLRTQVSVLFSPDKAVPGEKNTIKLSAEPGSVCCLSAVDQSVLILEPGRRLTAEAIFNLLPVQTLSGYPFDVEDEPECPPIVPWLPIIPVLASARRSILPIPRPQGNTQAYYTLKNMGLKIVTNLAALKPQCNLEEVTFRPGVMAIAAAEPPRRTVGSANSPKVTIRKVFPQTWLWQLNDVGASGTALVNVKVPDTITTWVMEVFCLSPKGLGLALPAQLTVFQPFFLELSLPYSIIRGESFELKATVFNYLSKCIMVTATPAASSNYTLQANSPLYSSCLCANGRKTFKWTLVPLVVGVLNVTISAQAVKSPARCGNEPVTVPQRGRIDVVTRSLLVQAEGVERTKTYSWLLCPQESSVLEQVTLTVPANVISGSTRCSVSVVGDILGRALKNLDGLVQQPSGCGEQNAAIFCPIIYVLGYLASMEQLTTVSRETALNFLRIGYQRELNYKHPDGSYSAFGTGLGNTWLTSFVLRCFGKAQMYIYIDPDVIRNATNWLVSKQGPDGCFAEEGFLYHNEMKGGVDDDVTMTAYIMITLLELQTPVSDPVVDRGLSCLRPVIGNVMNTYTTALLAYTFSLAGETNTRQTLLTKLDSVAITSGGLHWSQMVSGTKTTGSLAVEISSYVLLAVLTVNPLSAVDLGYANQIVHWLVQQQNPYGGFSSTQDTVVALQALSVYARVFHSSGSSTVTVSSVAETYQFVVNKTNKLLYQEKPLKNIPGKYTIDVKGSACVSVQIALFYNIPAPVQNTNSLSVEAKVTGDCLAKLMLSFTVKYSGTRASTNMVMVDIKLLSGFTADPSTVGLNSNSFVPIVERVDYDDDHVLVYLRAVPKDIPLSFSVQLTRAFQVKNVRPAVIKVYDYYEPSNQSETTYSSPCA
ncbi:alpha-2-macroglobulin-like protein 1 [Myxocyprinus asiaticus]|uniref:alpha-2-macroglobulin-like protein 1 n=1 Tax=Myxocyprinus asiaticus TaxID=70543 RepID=UPI0022219D73|nr:alpha-2-macroglobulin-like protein 1 [Myxocyprinus asiaticus]XP_051551630.1 alpha-2-macroglobulin-like protein 1 [Myxocyprinus asiaticus]XP_051551631.1 alpha-2-macroglobulin-like protein 1 [Myxocyprinus asiaticus]XP_051551633.1 alpha-2-macroglobulin-like protein 1 [Myxocyprinus asiaticus]